jgi:hypothetical protein
MGNPAYSADLIREDELRRRRVAEHLLACLNDPVIAEDVRHFDLVAEWTNTAKLCEEIRQSAPRSVKDRKASCSKRLKSPCMR